MSPTDAFHSAVDQQCLGQGQEHSTRRSVRSLSIAYMFVSDTLLTFNGNTSDSVSGPLFVPHGEIYSATAGHREKIK